MIKTKYVDNSIRGTKACRPGGFCKLYPQKTPITAADLLNDRVLPFFETHGVLLQRILTDRGTEFCGNAETHAYELYLAINDIDHTKTKAKSPQTNGICERFHKTVLQEFYQVTFRKKLYRSIDELQKDLDIWLAVYNEQRTHQGKMCCGRTPMETFHDGINAWKEKQIPGPANTNTEENNLIQRSFAARRYWEAGVVCPIAFLLTSSAHAAGHTILTPPEETSLSSCLSIEALRTAVRQATFEVVKDFMTPAQ